MSLETVTRSSSVATSGQARVRAVAGASLVSVSLLLLAASITYRGGDEYQLLVLASAWALVTALAVSSRRVVPDGTRGLTSLDPVLGLGALFGIALPVSNVYFGPPSEARGAVSTDAAASHVLAVSLVFFVMIVAGWVIIKPSKAPTEPVNWAPRRVAVLMLGLGTLGTVLRLSSGSQDVTQGSSLAGLLGTMLTPLLPVGAFLIICRPRMSVAPRVLGALVLVPPSLYALSTFSLNRAIFVVPVVAMFVVLVRQGRVRHVARTAIALATLGAIVFVLLGQVRLSLLREEYGAANVQMVTSSELLATSIQVYGQSPYLTGVALDSAAASKFRLETPVLSILSPLPRLGERYREENGTRLFNSAIGRGESNDQIIPVWLEAYLSGGILLLVALGTLVGVILKVLDNVIRRGTRSVSVYTASFASLWAAQSLIVSLLVLSQIFVYFVVPLALFFLVEVRRPGASQVRGR